MSLTPGLGYKGMRVQIYKPPPLPSGTLTLNPSGVTKSLPVPTHRWPGSIPMGISISTCHIWIHVGFHWVTWSHKSKTHGFSSPLMRTWTRCFKKINQCHQKSLSACFKKYMNGQASFETARDTIRHELHSQSPDQFPYGTRGTSDSVLVSTILAPQSSVALECICCDIY